MFLFWKRNILVLSNALPGGSVSVLQEKYSSSVKHPDPLSPALKHLGIFYRRDKQWKDKVQPPELWFIHLSSKLVATNFWKYSSVLACFSPNWLRDFQNSSRLEVKDPIFVVGFQQFYQMLHGLTTNGAQNLPPSSGVIQLLKMNVVFINFISTCIFSLNDPWIYVGASFFIKQSIFLW